MHRTGLCKKPQRNGKIKRKTSNSKSHLTKYSKTTSAIEPIKTCKLKKTYTQHQAQKNVGKTKHDQSRFYTSLVKTKTKQNKTHHICYD